MPLDTGGLTELEPPTQDAAELARPENAPPTIAFGANIGEALRAMREFKGLTQEDVAEATRVRRAYIAAIETMRMEALPSRPFTVGYVRAYAQALGLDADAAVRRFRQDVPETENVLPEPMGVQAGRDPRLALIGGAGAAIIAAIFAWNIIQRLMTEHEPAPPPVAAALPAPAPRNGEALSLGEPLPPPVESTTPPLYETPGLQASVEKAAAEKAGLPVPEAPATKTPPPAPAMPATFAPDGAVYGPPADEASGVVIQALKPASIVVRGTDGTVYFARQLAAGEAYRAPALAGVTVDASEVDALQVFSQGASKGALPVGSTPVGKYAE